MKTMKRPSNDECDSNKVFSETDEDIVFAAWYPQMGGYSSVCIIRASKYANLNNECFDVLVWHDGEFPFSGECGRSPTEIHHCVAEQFIELGSLVKEKAGRK